MFMQCFCNVYIIYGMFVLSRIVIPNVNVCLCYVMFIRVIFMQCLCNVYIWHVCLEENGDLCM